MGGRYLDDYYQGMIHLVRGELVAHLSHPIVFTGDDIAGIVDAVYREFIE